jgi:WD40 repeat protein
MTGEAHNSEVKIWDAASGQLLRVPPGGPFLALSPDGRRLAACTAGCGDEINVWDTATGSRLLSHELLSFPKEAATYTTSIAFRPDGRYLAAACGNGWTRADGEAGVGNRPKPICVDRHQSPCLDIHKVLVCAAVSPIHTPAFGFGTGGGTFSLALLVKSMPTLEPA